MKINALDLLDKAIVENVQHSGTFNIIVPISYALSKWISSISTIKVFKTTNDNKNYILGKIIVNKNTEKVEYSYNIPGFSINGFKLLIWDLILNEVCQIVEEEKPLVVYYYFDELLNLQVRVDKDETIDKENAKNHNYFLQEEYDRITLVNDLKQHIFNMRLNLLANFYPKLKGEK